MTHTDDITACAPEAGTNGVASAPGPPPDLDGAMLDALLEALMAGGNARGRAEVVGAVLDELGAAVAWLQDPDSVAAESAGLRAVRDAAYAHRRRMSIFAVNQARP